MKYLQSFRLFENLFSDEFKTLTSFKARLAYCNAHYERIGAGSSRVVFKDGERVIKLAKNAKGLAQNEEEISLAGDIYMKGIVTEVYDYARVHDTSEDDEYGEDSQWIISEYASKLSLKTFKDINGYPFKLFCEMLDSRHSYNKGFTRTGTHMRNEEIEESEFYENICWYLDNYDVPVGDLKRISTYGLVNREGDVHIVIVDYGLTEENYKQHYSR